MTQKGLIMCSRLRSFFLLFVIGFAFESAGWAASIAVAISPVEGAVGAQLRVPVLARDAQGAGALQMELTYDPSVLEAQGVDAGPILTGLLDFKVIRPGRLKIAMATSQAVTGSGELFIVTLKVLSSGQTRLGLENVAAWEESTSKEMAVTVEPGSFRTGGAADSVVSGPLVIGIGSALLTLIVAGLLVRKKLAGRGADRSSSPTDARLAQQPRAIDSEGAQVADRLRCSECGHAIASDEKFCTACGAPSKQPPATAICEACKRPISIDSKFCRHCGTSVQATAVHATSLTCRTCGKTLDGDSKFCPHCGAEMEKAKPVVMALHCPQCGTKLGEKDRFCSDCGAKVQ